MSGTKAFSVSAGISPTAVLGTVAAGAVVLGGVAAVAVGVGAAISLTGKALQSYQERKRREKEAAIEREKAVQQRIAQIKAMSKYDSNVFKQTVELPKLASQKQATGTNSQTIASVQEASVKDAQRRIERLRAQLPKIQSEYQNLIERQLLDATTVKQALQRTEEALNLNNFPSAEAHLQALDDARIQVLKQLKERWQPQIEYIKERLDDLSDRLPQSVIQHLQTVIDRDCSNWQLLTDDVINNFHQQINMLETQVVEIQEAAENLVNSWTEAGYEARIVAIDNGDAIVEVETHEGVNTQMRIQFNGQQIDLFGPPEESHSCATRTIEAMQLFQEQGYQLEWTHLDNEPVPEEWRHLYSPTSQLEEGEEELENEAIEDEELSHEREDERFVNELGEEAIDEEEDNTYYSPQSSQRGQVEQKF